MSNAMTTSEQRRVELCRKAGEWTLVIVSFGADVFAASQIPFSSLPALVINNFRSVGYKFDANNERTDSLINLVRQYEAIVQKILEKLNNTHVVPSSNVASDYIPTLETIMAGFVDILNAISFRCDKWLNKNLTKKMWSANKYDSELASLKQKLDDYKHLLDLGLAVVQNQAHAAGGVRVLVERLVDSKFQQMQKEREAFAKELLHSLQEMLEPLRHNLDTSEENQHQMMDILVGMNLSHNDRMDHLEDKIDEAIKILGAKFDEERKASRLFRLSSSEWRGFKSAISESGLPTFAATDAPASKKSRSAPITSFPDMETAYLVVEQVDLFSGALRPGDTATMTRLLTRKGQKVAYVVGGALTNRVFAKEERKMNSAKVLQNTICAPCHYWVTVTLSNGEQCTLERTAEADGDEAETCENAKSGVHMFWGTNTSRLEKQPVQSYTIRESKSVTLSNVLAFCDGERGEPYDVWNNNCKHFCFKLLQIVFGEEKGSSYSDFTADYNHRP